MRRTVPIIMAAAVFFAVCSVISSSNRHAVRTDGINGGLPCLVIDAGHGGLDGGAVSTEGQKESEINLAIASDLFDLCRFLGLDCRMTRETEELDYPPEAKSVREKKVWDLQRRAAFINGMHNAILLSIHQNQYPDTRPSGTQVIYAATDGSREFASLTHESLRRLLCPESRRVPVPAGNGIYLLNNVDCDAILVECGFLSNPAEVQKLRSAEYQRKIASILCASFLEYINPVA